MSENTVTAQQTQTPEALLQAELRRATAISSQYAVLERTFLGRLQEAIEDDDLTPSQINSLVKSLKELRALAPAPQLMPQQDQKPTVQIQFLSTTQLCDSVTVQTAPSTTTAPTPSIGS